MQIIVLRRAQLVSLFPAGPKVATILARRASERINASKVIVTTDISCLRNKPYHHFCGWRATVQPEKSDLTTESKSDRSVNEQYGQALAFLYGRINFERMPIMPYRTADLQLQRMRQLLRRLGNPERDLQIIHVAGTKGKGSTCSMIASILEQAGHNTGVYASPHLHRLEERFVVGNQECTESELVDLVDSVRPIVEQLDTEADDSAESNVATFFEITTAIALLHFARRKVDFAILEVGLGGRLDSTNVCQPIVSVITSISFDHMKQLGNTLAEIAFEKAGIIKPNCPTVSGVWEIEPRDVIRSIAGERGSRLSEVGTSFRIDSHRNELLPRGDYRSSVDAHQNLRLDNLEIGLAGDHQLENASVAIATCELLRQQGVRIDDESIRGGLRTVTCRARVEIIDDAPPTIVIDAAHNGASCKALILAVRPLLKRKPSVLVLATTQGKDVDAILRATITEFDYVVFTKYLKNPRAVSTEDLRSAALDINSAANCEIQPNPSAAIERATQLAGGQGMICVTGSFFIAAEIREALDMM